MLLNVVMIAGFAMALSLFFSVAAFVADYLSSVQDPPVGLATFTWFNAGEIIRTLLHLLQGRIPSNVTAYEFTSAIQTMTVALPTVAYVLLSAIAIGLRLTPSPVQRFVKICVFNLTTDKQPVFTQLGTLVGAIAAIVSALASALKPS